MRDGKNSELHTFEGQYGLFLEGKDRDQWQRLKQ